MFDSHNNFPVYLKKICIESFNDKLSTQSSQVCLSYFIIQIKDISGIQWMDSSQFKLEPFIGQKEIEYTIWNWLVFSRLSVCMTMKRVFYGA